MLLGLRECFTTFLEGCESQRQVLLLFYGLTFPSFLWCPFCHPPCCSPPVASHSEAIPGIPLHFFLAGDLSHTCLWLHRALSSACFLLCSSLGFVEENGEEFKVLKHRANTVKLHRIFFSLKVLLSWWIVWFFSGRIIFK